MKRRDFVATSLAASAAGLAANTLSARGVSQPGAAAGTGVGADSAPREYYQLLLWRLRRGPQQKLVDDLLRDALIPSLGRAGLGPVGVFNTTIGPQSPSVYVLVPGPSVERVANLPELLFADPAFRQASGGAMNAPATEPAYVRLETSLLRAFAGMPKLEVPASAAAHRPRIFELRIYESHSKKANLTKIDMFNQGEIAIFRRTGLTPVFFGETLVGSNYPNLTYMLTFDDMAQREKAWGAFVGDPEWKKMSTTPGYTDVETVSNISNAILTPAPYSQL